MNPCSQLMVMYTDITRSPSNPNIVLEQDKLVETVMVWAGIWSGERVGPYF